MVTVGDGKRIITSFRRAQLLLLDFTYALRITKALFINERRETSSKSKDIILENNMPPNSATHLCFPYRNAKEFWISMQAHRQRNP
jgi:hypothetical protein